MAVKVDTFTGPGNWTATFTGDVLVEVWGTGGGGSTNTGGGGGGEYAAKVVSVVQDQVYAVGMTATPASNTDGGATTFDSTAVVANGGLSGANGGTGGTGGTGDTTRNGGNGALGTGNQAGGGAAGDAAAGSGSTGGASNGGYGCSGATGPAGIRPGSTFGGGGSSTSGGGTPGARGHLRITYTVPDDTLHPNVQARSWGRNTSGSTSHTITMPAGIEAGDLLLLLFSCNGNPTVTCSGWTKIGQDNSTSTTLAVFYKTAAGSDTATVSTTQSQISVHQVFRIDGHDGVPEATFANAGTSPGDPPEHTASVGVGAHLWIAGVSKRSTSNSFNAEVTAAPSGYESLMVQPGALGTNVHLLQAAAERDQVFAETEDPGAFSGNGSSGINVVTATICIPGAATGAWESAPEVGSQWEPLPPADSWESEPEVASTWSGTSTAPEWNARPEMASEWGGVSLHVGAWESKPEVGSEWQSSFGTDGSWRSRPELAMAWVPRLGAVHDRCLSADGTLDLSENKVF
jgi:hypothetical protein